MTEVKSIPIRLVKPHPKLASRFKHEVSSLAALIKAAVSDDTPNGQLEPGRVVPREDGEEYYVYIGVRRYYALILLYQETGDERFAVFNAYIDSEKSVLELFLRAKRENEDGKGERLGVSVLEEVFSLFKIRDSVSPEKLDSEIKREFVLAEKLDEEKLRKLFEVESMTHFEFTVGHLERLCEIHDQEDFYRSAACTAGFGVSPERIEKAIEGRDAAHTLKWFGSVFPKIKPSSARPQVAASAPEANKEPLEVHEKEAIVLSCPACGAMNMTQLHLNAEVTRLPGDPSGERVTATPDVVIMYVCPCYHCPKELSIFIKPLGGRRYAAEASVSRKFREPKEVVQAVDLRVDFKENVWQKIVEDRVVGVVRVHGRTKK